MISISFSLHWIHANNEKPANQLSPKGMPNIILHDTTQDTVQVLPVNTATHVAEERENRYVANQATAGKIPVSKRANIDAIAHPK